ncbi:hypothetical protein M8C21_001390, partial [Ambrosia artemisiifolia]
MGTHFKRSIFDEHIQAKVVGWAMHVKKRWPITVEPMARVLMAQLPPLLLLHLLLMGFSLVKLIRTSSREPAAEIDMMKENFAKLLLGEDMSGGGKGVYTALAISNAITNLSASVFGELRRLEPLSSQKKALWQREMYWLLSISDSIIDFVPTTQQSPDGCGYEVMATQPKADLSLNLAALKKLDSMLIGMLDEFCNTEFWYVDSGVILAEGEAYSSGVCGGRPSIRQEEKWWLPYPKVPSNGLSEDVRKRLQQCRDCTYQLIKAALAINSNVLTEMEIPNAY